MKELLKYLIIRITTRHAKTAIDIYNTLYPNQKEVVYVDNTTSVVSVQNAKSKKDEIIDSLNYLKNKKIKTKQDKESIYSLEMVLKNIG
jgi:hypothetical protein